MINNIVTSFEERHAAHSSSYKHQVQELQKVARERHKLFEHMVTSSKESITLKVHELIDLFSKEVTQLDKLCVRIKDNVDVLIGVTQTLMEDI